MQWDIHIHAKLQAYMTKFSSKKKKVYMTKIHRIILQMLPILAKMQRESQSVGDYYSTCRTIQPTFS